MRETKRPLGPNLKKFIFHKMSVDAIPAGSGFGAGVVFLITPGRMAAGFRSAAEWCDLAITAIRNAAEPNPWRDSDEEEIAAEIMRRINERKLAAKT